VNASIKSTNCVEIFFDQEDNSTFLEGETLSLDGKRHLPEWRTSKNNSFERQLF
jgi:hypothetical protein